MAIFAACFKALQKCSGVMEEIMSKAVAAGAAGRSINSRIENYRNMTPAQRLAALVEVAGLSDAEVGMR